MHDSGEKHSRGGITKQGRRDLRTAMVSAANHAAALGEHPFWKQEFQRLEGRIGRPKAIIALARKLLVAVWHILTREAADRHADARSVACSLFKHAYAVGVRNLPVKLSAREYVRYELDRLGIGAELTEFRWGTKTILLPPSRLKR